MRCRNRLIAFTARIFEMLAIENVDDSPGVTDCTFFLKCACGYGYRCPPAAKDPSKRLLSQRDTVGHRTIVSHEQAAAKALLDGVKFIADGSLGNLDKEHVRVVLQNAI